MRATVFVVGTWLPRMRVPVLAVVLTVGLTPATATSIKTVELADLFAEADLVALVSILAADGEAFDGAVYKAAVVEGFKGAQAGDNVFFGPYVTYGLGRKYVVFLERTPDTLEQKRDAPGGPWPESNAAPYYAILYAGYSVLPVEYTCAIPDCDEGVAIVGSQVLLPDDLPVIPQDRESDSSDDVWVRKADFLRLLSSLRDAER